MSEAPVQLLVAAFTEEDAADKVFEQLKQAKKEMLIHIQDVAVIKRDADSKIHINEPKDWKAGKGAGVGALVGAALGIITGPGVVFTTAAGAAIGGLAAKMRDAGFPDDQLKQVGEALKPGTSAIVAIIEHTWVADLEQEMQAQGAQVMRQAISEDITKQLEAGRDVAYSVVATEGAATAQRVSAGENDAQIDSAMITQDALSATTATGAAEGITGTTVVATDQGAVVADFTARSEEPAAEGSITDARAKMTLSSLSATSATDSGLLRIRLHGSGFPYNQIPVSIEIIDEQFKVTRLAMTGSTELELKSGYYLVQVHLPSGKTYGAGVRVAKGGYNAADLFVSPSIDTQLAWPAFLGDVPDQSENNESHTFPSTWFRLWTALKQTQQSPPERAANSTNEISWRIESPSLWKKSGADNDKVSDKVNVICRVLKPIQANLRMLQFGGEFTPWRTISLPPTSEEVQVVVQPAPVRTEQNGGLWVTAVSMDYEAETVLHYLAFGEVAAARTIGPALVARAKKSLSEAKGDQMAATIAGYYLLRMGQLDLLRDWSETFADKADWLPDSAVIHAWQLLRSGTESPDPLVKVEEARAWFMKAVRRGIPVYTEGVRLLIDGLEVYSDEAQGEISNALERIRTYAAAMDWDQALTAFYGENPLEPSVTPVVGVPSAVQDLLIISATPSAEGITETTVNATEHGTAVADFDAAPESSPLVEGSMADAPSTPAASTTPAVRTDTPTISQSARASDSIVQSVPAGNEGHELAERLEPRVHAEEEKAKQLAAAGNRARGQILGPIQLVVIGLHNENLKGQIAQELKAATASGSIRVLDALAIQKTTDGKIKSLGGTDLTPSQRKNYGALVGALMGLGSSGTVEGAEAGAELGEKAFAKQNFGLTKADIKALAAGIPVDRTILLVLFEHRWAVELKKALLSANGEMLAQGFIQPETLVEFGEELGAARAAAQEDKHVTA